MKLKAGSHSKMPNFGSDVNWFTDNKTTQQIRKFQNKKENKYDSYIYHRTWQILTAIVFYSKHDVHKFIAEHIMCWILWCS